MTPRLTDAIWPGRTWRLQTTQLVSSDFPGCRAHVHHDVVVEHDAIRVNAFGAVSVVTPFGVLGLRPAEFWWLSDPPWPGWPADPPWPVYPAHPNHETLRAWLRADVGRWIAGRLDLTCSYCRRRVALNPRATQAHERSHLLEYLREHEPEAVPGA